MGKFRGKSKRVSSRFDPCDGRPAKKLKNEPHGLTILMGKLSSIEECDYLHGLHTLGALAGDGLDSVTAILNFANDEGSGALLRQVSRFLLHQKLYVRLAAVGTIRNLSSCGSGVHIETLLQSDLLITLCKMVPSCLQDLMNSDASLQLPDVSDIFSILEQIAFILYNICEASAEATVVVCECPKVISSLLKLCGASSVELQHDIPATCRFAANLAMLCLSEDNPCVAQELENYKDQLKHAVCLANQTSFSTSEITESLAFSHFNALIVAGIVINVDACVPEEDFTLVVLQLVARVLSVSPHLLLGQHVSAVSPTRPEETTNDVVTPSSALSPDDLNLSIIGNLQQNAECAEEDEEQQMGELDESEANDQEIVFQFEQTNSEQDNGCLSSSGWQAVQYWLEAQQLALEILNNMCCSSDDDSSEVHDKRKLAVEDEDDDDMDQEGAWEPCNDEGIEKVLKPFIEENQLFNRVFEVLRPVDSEQYSTLQNSKYFKQLQTLMDGVRVRALSALQVEMELLSMDTLGGPERLFQCWVDLGRLAFAEHQQQKVDDGILEGATGAMRAVVSKYETEHAIHLSAISTTELEMLFSVGLSCSVPGVRRNVARLVGELCCLIQAQGDAQDLMRDPVNSVLVKTTDFLLQLAGTDSELPVCAEALDVVMDVYSDDRTDHLAADCKLVSRLQTVKNYFKARYKQDRLKCKQHSAILLMVKENLPAFIKYKESRVLSTVASKSNASNQRPEGPKPKKGKGNK